MPRKPDNEVEEVVEEVIEAEFVDPPIDEEELAAEPEPEPEPDTSDEEEVVPETTQLVTARSLKTVKARRRSDGAQCVVNMKDYNTQDYEPLVERKKL